MGVGGPDLELLGPLWVRGFGLEGEVLGPLLVGLLIPGIDWDLKGELSLKGREWEELNGGAPLNRR